jgi:hypothetical protein
MNKPLLEGLSDAAGFLCGALLGWGFGRLIGADVMTPGYGLSAIAGIALIGLGSGMGLQAARHWRMRREQRARRDGGGA